MSFQKESFTLGILISFVFICNVQSPTKAASVYAIPKHTGKTVNVYDIQEGTQEGLLGYRATYDLNPNLNPTDIIIDTWSNMLFVTSEYSRVIQLINARTFLSEGEVEADGATDLAGVLIHQVDPNTTLLYTVDRGTNKLFVYDWDADECYFGLF